MILRAGFVASRTLDNLDNGRAGHVVAAFERSAYVDFDGQLVCVAQTSLDDGPLMLRLDDFPGFRIGMEYTVSTALRRVWRPPLPYGWTKQSLTRGLAALRSIVLGVAPAEGLGCFALEAEQREAFGSPEVKAAQIPIECLQQWLVAMFQDDVSPAPDEASALVGLGPGLTPSGDDYLGGAMIAAHALNRPDIAARLYEIVLAGNTGMISAAHLAAASEGAASASLHLLMNDVLCGRAANLAARLNALNTMGHSSGWDAFAGVMAALRAAARSEGLRSQAA